MSEPDAPETPQWPSYAGLVSAQENVDWREQYQQVPLVDSYFDGRERRRDAERVFALRERETFDVTALGDMHTTNMPGVAAGPATSDDMADAIAMGLSCGLLGEPAHARTATEAVEQERRRLRPHDIEVTESLDPSIARTLNGRPVHPLLDRTLDRLLRPAARRGGAFLRVSVERCVETLGLMVTAEFDHDDGLMRTRETIDRRDVGGLVFTYVSLQHLADEILLLTPVYYRGLMGLDTSGHLDRMYSSWGERRTRAERRREAERYERLNVLNSDLDYGAIPYRENPYAFGNTADACEKGMALLKANLTPEQLHSLNAHGHFEVVGGSTGRRYRIATGRQLNVYQLNKGGNVIAGLCFVPAGNLVAGDVMLAQKNALELAENEALRVARPFTDWNTNPLMHGIRGMGRGDVVVMDEPPRHETATEIDIRRNETARWINEMSQRMDAAILRQLVGRFTG